MKKVLFFLLLVSLLTCCAEEKDDRTDRVKTSEDGMKIVSSAFKDNTRIPDKYSCRGEDINPPLYFMNVPKDAVSLALVVDDPDAPSGTWVHWVIWNIPVDSSGINEGSVPSGAVQGINSAKKRGYHGPCPPSGTHRYYFKLYALDSPLNIPEDSDKKTLEDAMRGHILAEAHLIGLFSN